MLRLLLPVSFSFLSDSIVLPISTIPGINVIESNLSELSVQYFTNSNTGIESGSTLEVIQDTPLRSIFLIIWILGFIILLSYFTISYIRCLKEFKTSLPIDNSYIDRLLEKHPIKRQITVRTLSGISTPLTYGLLHPTILLPKNIDWENEHQLDYIVVHECTHVRRFDIIRKLLVTVVLCIYWFNPLVWVLYILLNRDIELACDESVIQHFNGNNRASYARTLIELEEQRCSLAPFYNNFAKNAIEERIKFIMKSRRKSTLALVLSLIFILLGTTTAFAAKTGYRSLPLSSHSSQHTEVQHQNTHQTTSTFISSMGCNDVNCTDSTHYHSCSPACENESHDHTHEENHTSSEHQSSAKTGFTKVNHHNTQNTNKDSHH